MKGPDRFPIVSTEAEVHTRSWGACAKLGGDRELHVELPGHRAVVRAAPLEIEDPDEPDGPQCSVVEPAAPFEVCHTQGNMVEHGGSCDLSFRGNVPARNPMFAAMVPGHAERGEMEDVVKISGRQPRARAPDRTSAPGGTLL